MVRVRREATEDIVLILGGIFSIKSGAQYSTCYLNCYCTSLGTININMPVEYLPSTASVFQQESEPD